LISALSSLTEALSNVLKVQLLYKNKIIAIDINGTLDDGVSRRAKAQFGPLGTYSTANDNSGLGEGRFTPVVSTALFCGGSHVGGQETGIFGVRFNLPTSFEYADLGFRYTYVS